MTHGHLTKGVYLRFVIDGVIRLDNLLKIDLVAVVQARIDFHGIFKQTRIGLDTDALAHSIHEALADGIEIVICEQGVCKLRAVLPFEIIGDPNALDGFFPVFVGGLKNVFKWKNTRHIHVEHRAH